MVKYKRLCAYCGKKCDMKKDYCITQDSIYICRKCYDENVLIKNKKTDLKEIYKTISLPERYWG